MSTINFREPGEFGDGATMIVSPDGDHPLKPAFVAFFCWWWNQPGTNTEQGFDDWAAGPGAAILASLNAKEPS